MSNETETEPKEPTIRALRRQAFKKREQIMRKALRQSFDILIKTAEKTEAVNNVGQIIANALNEEEAVIVPYGSSQWRDMDSAPKDGTHILVYQRAAFAEHEHAVAVWNGDVWSVVPTKDYRLCAQPIAWMPLPTPTKPSVTVHNKESEGELK